MSMNRVILAGLVMVVGGAAGIPAWGANTVFLKNGRQMNATSIEWRQDAQQYVVATGGTTVPIPVAQVDRVVVDKPADLDRAAALVQSRSSGQAIPLLEGLVQKYRMLNWDVEASRLLARAYLDSKDIKKAMPVMDGLFAAGGEQVPADLQQLYWKTLMESGSNDQLRKVLDQSIGTGGPAIVSAAYMMRGNLFLKMGEEDAALSDFLKVTTIYQAVKAHQPEALFRAAELLDKARDVRGAELRKKVIQDYPGSEFAVKAAAKPAAAATKK